MKSEILINFYTGHLEAVAQTENIPAGCGSTVQQAKRGFTMGISTFKMFL